MMNQRIKYLDAIRGLAAIGVMIWHYQHFFLLSGVCDDSGQEGVCNDSEAPLYSVLKYFYENGFRMVDLFFIISGLVMFTRYENAISERKVTVQQFFVARVARLWPLALATLCVAAILTWTYRVAYGSFLFYEDNDLTTFILNALFVHAGFFRGVDLSFNGPSWTIAIEFWMYLSLYLILRFVRRPIWVVCALFLSCTVLQINHDQSQLSLWYRGLSGFGMGMLIALIRQQFYKNGRSCKGAKSVLAAITFVSAMLVILQMYYPQLDIVTSFSDETRAYLWHLLAIFSPVVLLAAVSTCQSDRISLISRWLGSRSFGIYMWHVPIQMMLVLLIRFSGVENPTFSIWFFAVYILLVFVAADLGFRLIEEPMRIRVLRAI